MATLKVCPSGHVVSEFDAFCRVCGQRASSTVEVSESATRETPYRRSRVDRWLSATQIVGALLVILSGALPWLVIYDFDNVVISRNGILGSGDPSSILMFVIAVMFYIALIVLVAVEMLRDRTSKVLRCSQLGVSVVAASMVVAASQQLGSYITNANSDAGVSVATSAWGLGAAVTMCIVVAGVSLASLLVIAFAKESGSDEQLALVKERPPRVGDTPGT